MDLKKANEIIEEMDDYAANKSDEDRLLDLDIHIAAELNKLKDGCPLKYYLIIESNEVQTIRHSNMEWDELALYLINLGVDILKQLREKKESS